MSYRKTEGDRLRRLAAECREMAAMISLRPDREKILEAAEVYERAAAALEGRVVSAEKSAAE